MAWDTFAQKERGLAQIVDNQLLENGATARALKTHPDFSPGGFIEGVLHLPRAAREGDRFTTNLGFYVDSPPCYTGETEFGVDAVFPSGASRQLLRTHDVAADREGKYFDIDLGPYAGAVKIRLRVDAGPAPTCDWAAWWDTSIISTAA